MRLIAVLLALLLAACGTLSPAPAPTAPPALYLAHLAQIKHINAFAMHGRIAILTQAKGFSGGVRWHHHVDGDDIGLYSPLGSQLGQITRDQTGVTLTNSSGNSLHANDAETLTQQALGWSLPLSGLADWMLGRPANDAVEVLAWDDNGNITRMQQQGWDIQYTAYKTYEGIPLPGKITLKNQKLDLKLVVEDWEYGTE